MTAPRVRVYLRGRWLHGSRLLECRTGTWVRFDGACEPSFVPWVVADRSRAIYRAQTALRRVV